MLWDSAFDYFNNISMFIMGISLLIFPVFVLVFYCKKFAKWSDESFQDKYGAIFEGLRTDRRSSLAYPIIFVLRRFIFVFLAIVTKQYFFIQLFVMILISVGQVAYLTVCKPFEEPLLLKLEIFNEVTTVVLIDLLTCFTRANTMPLDLEMDINFLVGLFGNIAVHLYFLIKNSVKNIRLYCRKKRCCRRKNDLKAKMAPSSTNDVG